MPTQAQLDLAKKYGYTQEQINQELANPGSVKRSAVSPIVPTTPPITPTGATYAEQNILSPNVTGFTKPVIATKDAPVISTPSAVGNVETPGDYNSMTPEQLKSTYMTIIQKDPSTLTDTDRQFTRYLRGRISLGETTDKIFGTSTSKSSGTTTYSQQLNRSPEQISDTVKNADGTWTVKYKDGASQVITEQPSKTIFPEGTPEYYLQKQADEGEKRIQVLTEQMNTEAERRKKETADLVAKYGENIATQFQNQKAEIESNGAKRMEALNSGLSFSGFGRSTLALEKRDEIAKNIEATINQAKAKADLELMAYRMEREGADAEAIGGAGGAGGATNLSGAGGGGGGAGGNGGFILIFYGSKTTVTGTVNGGAGGAGGVATAPATNSGVAGTAGNAGLVLQIQI